MNSRKSMFYTDDQGRVRYIGGKDKKAQGVARIKDILVAPERKKAGFFYTDEEGRTVFAGGPGSGAGGTSQSGSEDVFARADALGLKVAYKPSETAELLADVYAEKYGFDAEHPREQFIASMTKTLADAPVPEEFVRQTLNDILPEIEAGRAGALPLIFHGERAGYNDRWVDGQYDAPGMIRFLYHTKQTRLEKEELGQSPSTVSNTYRSLRGGVYVHEYGHHATETLNLQSIRRAGTVLDNDQNIPLLKRTLSRYSVTNDHELAAECYTARVHPQFNRLPAETRNLILYVLGEQ